MVHELSIGQFDMLKYLDQSRRTSGSLSAGPPQKDCIRNAGSWKSEEGIRNPDVGIPSFTGNHILA